MVTDDHRLFNRSTRRMKLAFCGWRKEEENGLTETWLMRKEQKFFYRVNWHIQIIISVKVSIRELDAWIWSLKIRFRLKIFWGCISLYLILKTWDWWDWLWNKLEVGDVKRSEVNGCKFQEGRVISYRCLLDLLLFSVSTQKHPQ